MLAARIHGYGTADEFVLEQVAEPDLGPEDVRIDVHATSVNPVDYKIRQGSQRGVIRLGLPSTLGMDVSGIVLEVGSSVTNFQVGDEVFASPSHRRMGTYAEQVVVRAAETAPKPQSISHLEAASLPLTALTAYDSLVTACRLQSGQSVLIQAGSGGVGTIAIQLAKHLGAKVFTTCSPRNHDLVRELGADVAIDYRSENFEHVAKGVDAALESVGGDDIARVSRTVRRGGHVAMITTGLPEMTKRFGPTLGVVALAGQLAWRIARARLADGTRLHVVARTPSGKNLSEIARLVDAGAIRPIVDRTFGLEAIGDAHRYLETGRARGKVVVAVK